MSPFYPPNQSLYSPDSNRFSELTFDHQAPLITTSSTKSNHHHQQQQQLLQLLGQVLNQADQSLSDLTHNELLGSAIVRACRDLAKAVGRVADELEQQTNLQRRALAEACLQDAQSLARPVSVSWNNNNDNDDDDRTFPLTEGEEEEENAMAQFNADDILLALAGVSPLLRDIEQSLRAIEQDEADEIADVALTLAKLFVASLQSFHSHVLQKEEQQQRQLQSDRFELLEEDDNEEEKTKKEPDPLHTNTTTTTTDTTTPNSDHDHAERIRVLWPPLGPAVASVCAWGKDEAIQQPILAVALGMTLWPAAVVTALFGAPLVVADAIVQHTYGQFQNGPLVSSLEKGAAQFYQAGKLSWLCGKLVTRQTVRILQRQLDRQGGIGPVLQTVAGMAVDRALHPIETVGAMWEGVHWVWGVVQDNWRVWHPQHGGAASAAAAGAAAAAGQRYESGEASF